MILLVLYDETLGQCLPTPGVQFHSGHDQAPASYLARLGPCPDCVNFVNMIVCIAVDNMDFL